MPPDIFLAIEQSAFGVASKSGPWLYPAANVAHVVGATLLVGAIMVFDILALRGRFDQARAISDVALPVAVAGFVLILISAPVLFAAEASALVRNQVFLAKMALLLVGLGNVVLFYARRPEGRAAMAHAAVSAVVWLTVVIAGRSIAYA